MTESEEMYLITIAQLSEDGMAGPIPLSRLAEELSVLPVSVNQMIHKMDETGMVRYIPYKGVELTPKGRQIAARMLRLRRLWEVFLVEKLGLSLDEADDLACRMEHITSDDVAGCLSVFLGNPVISPQGRPIPQVDGEAWTAPQQPLDNLKVGQSGVVVSLEADDATHSFLSGEGIRPGMEVFILGISNNGTMLLKCGKSQMTLDAAVAEKVLTRKIKTTHEGDSLEVMNE